MTDITNGHSVNLVSTYVAWDLSIPGRRKADLLRDLNRACNVSYTHSRLNEMMRGEREPNRVVRNYMLRCVIDHVLQTQLGVNHHSDEALDRVADLLT